MIGISISFLPGRYHATPWGRHVNEGVPEWPPSPWRLLRSLVAVWKRTLPDLPQTEVAPFLRAVVHPPLFVLPAASSGHSRHFMPWFKKGPDDRTLVFDTFVVVEPATPIIVLWPDARIAPEQRDILGRILQNLNVLGRAESWCDARLLAEAEASNLRGSVNCYPFEGVVPQGDEIVRVLCADPESAFANDCFATSAGKRGKKIISYDPNWHLCAETLWLHEENWSDPPGSRWLRYLRRQDCFDTLRTNTRQRPSRSAAHIARFVIDSTVLPLVTETLPFAEAARRAIMSLHGRLTARNGVHGRSSTLSGKNECGEPLFNHDHAYYLPSDEDGDGRLDHLTIIARRGFDSQESLALHRFSKISTGREMEKRYETRLLLLTMKTLEAGAPGPTAKAKNWESATPYIATRYAKTRGRDRRCLESANDRMEFLIENLRMQLAQIAGRDSGIVIEPLVDEHGTFRISGRWRTIEFKRDRSKSRDDGGRRLAGAFRLRFQDPVAGPMAVGHSAHFGMGLFRPTTI